MAQKLYEESNIQNIANAIREKNGFSDKYTTSQMADAIRSIEGGSSESFLQKMIVPEVSYTQLDVPLETGPSLVSEEEEGGE